MSRFIYKVYYNDEFIEKFTSINQMLNCMPNFRGEMMRRLIKAFEIPPFTKRFPQTYIDESIGLKVISEYIEQTGYL
ncbi:MAG: hypothetical protein H6586_04990 [Flavobacteriales bacterium]|nr:hypothetical protein [Flavobacteriales bacterium]